MHYLLLLWLDAMSLAWQSVVLFHRRLYIYSPFHNGYGVVWVRWCSLLSTEIACIFRALRSFFLNSIDIGVCEFLGSIDTCCVFIALCCVSVVVFFYLDHGNLVSCELCFEVMFCNCPCLAALCYGCAVG